jgi:iron(III) transport system permease protein
MYDFPLKSILEKILILGMVFPSYVLAFFYSETFGMFGKSALIGTMVVTTLPYVFMIVTMSIRSQSQQLVYSAMMLGKDYYWIKLNLLMPLIKPSLILSTLLVIGDTFSEFGATYFFGVDTVMTGIYEIWFGLHESVQGIRFSAWVFVTMLTVYYFINVWKKSIIGNQPKLTNGDSPQCIQPIIIEKFKWLYTFIVLSIVTITFLIPLGVLVSWINSTYITTDWVRVFKVTFNSSILATLISFLVLLTTTVILYLFKNKMIVVTALSNAMYSTPGIVLTITAIFVINQTFVGMVTTMFVYVLVLKYLAMGIDSVGVGIQKINVQYYYSAKTLDKSSAWYICNVQIPISYQSYIVGGILVWIDVIRELVIGLTLRPQWLSLLSVEIYRYMDMEKLSSSGPWILAMVVVTIIPIYWINLVLKFSKN